MKLGSNCLEMQCAAGHFIIIAVVQHTLSVFRLSIGYDVHDFTTYSSQPYIDRLTKTCDQKAIYVLDRHDAYHGCKFRICLLAVCSFEQSTGFTVISKNRNIGYGDESSTIKRSHYYKSALLVEYQWLDR